MSRQEHHASSTGHKTVSGVLWLVFQTVSGRGVAIVAQLVLAHLLMPEDFGVLGLATTLTGIFSVLVGLGVDQVLQQRGRWIGLWATQAFVLSFLLSTLAALVMAACGPFAAHIYNNDELLPLVWVAALGFPIQALSVVPEVRLKADLRFKLIALYTSVEFFVQQLLIILLAWLDFGALSFVLPIPVLAAVKAAVFWIYAPKSSISLRRARGYWQMIKRGSSVLGSKLCNAVVDQGDYITLGLMASTKVVGFYFFAFKLSSMPMRLLAMNFVSVLFPALVSLNHDPQKQIQAALRTAGIIAFVVTPVCVLQAAVSEPVLTILFGDRWSNSIIFMQILSLGLPIDAANWAAGSYLSAKGQFAKKFYLQLAFAPVFYLLVLCGGFLASATGVAVGVTLYYIIFPLCFSFVAFKGIEHRFTRILRSYMMPYALSLVTIGGAYLLTHQVLGIENPWLQIIVISGVSGLLYLAAAYAVMRPVLFDLIDRLWTVLIRRGRKAENKSGTIEV